MWSTYPILTNMNDQGEMSAMINLARTLGGFSVTFFQIPWAAKHGAIQTFGCEAAVVAGLFLLLVPMLQLKGRFFRVGFVVLSFLIITQVNSIIGL